MRVRKGWGELRDEKYAEVLNKNYMKEKKVKT